jgi:hypothetical protein
VSRCSLLRNHAAPVFFAYTSGALGPAFSDAACSLLVPSNDDLGRCNIPFFIRLLYRTAGYIMSPALPERDCIHSSCAIAHPINFTRPLFHEVDELMVIRMSHNGQVLP